MSRAAHAASPAHLPHVTPPVYGYHHSTHAAIHAILPHVTPPANDYLQAPFAPPSSRAPDPSVGQRHGPVRCMGMRDSVETVLHMCIYYNVYHVFLIFFVNKHENITLFSNFFLAKFGGLC